MFRQTQKGFGEETVVDKQFDLPQFVSGSGPQFVSGSVPQFVSGSGPQFISGFHPISNTPLKDNNTHNVTTPIMQQTYSMIRSHPIKPRTKNVQAYRKRRVKHKRVFFSTDFPCPPGYKLASSAPLPFAHTPKNATQ